MNVWDLVRDAGERNESFACFLCPFLVLKVLHIGNLNQPLFPTRSPPSSRTNGHFFRLPVSVVKTLLSQIHRKTCTTSSFYCTFPSFSVQDSSSELS